MDTDKVLEFRRLESESDAPCAWGSRVTWGWVLRPGLWIVPQWHSNIAENAIYLMYAWEYEEVLKANTDTDPNKPGAVFPNSPYRCTVEGQEYWPMGWWGQSWNRFGLLDAYFILKDYNPKWNFIQHNACYEYMNQYQFDWPAKAAIESRKDERYDYYLEQDLQELNPKCPVCNQPLCRPHYEIEPTIIYWWPTWSEFGYRYGLSTKQIEKLYASDMGTEGTYTYSSMVCSPPCQHELEKAASHCIHERIESWARKKHEKDKMDRLKSLTFKAKRALATGNRDALQSLKEAFAQEATLPNSCRD